MPSILRHALFAIALACLLPTLAARAAGPPRLAEARARAHVDLTIAGGTEAADLYAAIARQAGLDLVLDPHLRSPTVTLASIDRPAAEALDVATQAAGHFWTSLDAKTVLVADDTPQNRRTYTPQVVDTFHLSHIGVKEMMTTLRSLYSLKHIAADLERHTISVRDSAPKIALVAATITRLDRAPSEVDLDVEVLRLPRHALDALRQRGAPAPLRIPVDRTAALRATGRVLAAPTLTASEGRVAHFELDESLPWSTDQPARVQLRLQMAARVDAHDNTLILDLEVEGRLGHPEHPDAQRSGSSTLRLQDGDAILLTDWLPVGDPAAGEATVVMVIPRSIRPSALATPSPAIYLGSEAHIIAP